MTGILVHGKGNNTITLYELFSTWAGENDVVGSRFIELNQSSFWMWYMWATSSTFKCGCQKAIRHKCQTQNGSQN